MKVVINKVTGQKTVWVFTDQELENEKMQNLANTAVAIHTQETGQEHELVEVELSCGLKEDCEACQ
jgi:hypothetical protein